MNNNKTSVAGRVLSIISGVIAIIMTAGKWLDLYQVPIIMGNYKEYKYSLFEIQDFLSTFNLYVKNDTIKAYADFLLIMTTVVIILSVITMLISLSGTKTAKVFSLISIISAIVLSGVVIGFVVKTNLNVKDATYDSIDELLRLTYNPWLLVAFTIIQRLFLNIKMKSHLSVLPKTVNDSKQCSSCGAYLPPNASFCNKCGEKVQPVNNTNNFCTACGNPIPEGVEFCASCGTKVKKESMTI